MGRVSNADLAPVLELEHLLPTADIQRDRIRPWRLAALLVSETTPLMAASRYSGFVAVWSMAASCDAWLAHRMSHRRRSEKGLTKYVCVIRKLLPWRSLARLVNVRTTHSSKIEAGI